MSLVFVNYHNLGYQMQFLLFANERTRKVTLGFYPSHTLQIIASAKVFEAQNDIGSARKTAVKVNPLTESPSRAR